MLGMSVESSGPEENLSVQTTQEMLQPNPNVGLAVARRAGGFALRAAGAVLGASLLVGTHPYEVSLDGSDGKAPIPVEISARVFDTPGQTITSNLFGSIDTKGITSLPIKFTAAPSLSLPVLQQLNLGGTAYIEEVRADAMNQIKPAVAHFGMWAALGLVGGSLGTDLALRGARNVFGRREEEDEKPRSARVRQFAASAVVPAAAATAAIGIVGAATYEPANLQDVHMTGMIAEAKILPEQLNNLAKMDMSSTAVGGAVNQIRALLNLQEAILKPAADTNEAPAAVKIMQISDMHDRNMYGLIREQAIANDVDVVVNTGDETEYGVDEEIMSEYRAAIRAITAPKEEGGLGIPMLWVRGNHDSWQISNVMAKIPGVYVLDKQMMNVDGLWIAGLGDPRTYSDGGVTGGPVEQAAQRKYVNDSLPSIHADNQFDIFLTHEPAAGEEAQKQLGDRDRVVMQGHLHTQNDVHEIQHGDQFNIIEGTTGRGGLTKYSPNSSVPVSWSILSIGGDCQVQSIMRVQQSDPTLPQGVEGQTNSSDSSLVTYKFKPQSGLEGRVCTPSKGIGQVLDWSVAQSTTLSALTSGNAQMQK